MNTISIKIPDHLASALDAFRQDTGRPLVPWLAAWLLADHRISGTAWHQDAQDVQQLLQQAEAQLSANGTPDNDRLILSGESGTAILHHHDGNLSTEDTWIEESDGAAASSHVTEGPTDTDHASDGERALSTTRKKADIYLHLSGQDVTIASPSGRYDEIALHGWRRFLRHLLIELLLIKNRPLAELPNLAGSIKALVLNTWSGNVDACVRLPQATVIERFDLQCRRSPDALAIRMPGKQPVNWTYSQLRSLSLQYAAWLQSLDVQPGQRVAMLLSRRPESIALMLGILRLGAVYVPIDPASPEQRLSLMLADCQPALLLTERSTSATHQAIARSLALPMVDIDQALQDGHLPPPSSAGPDTVPQSEQVSEDTLVRSRRSSAHAAYVMYTSGSTGTPKGVVIPHRGIVRLVYRQYFAPLGPKVVMLHAAPLAFDASTLEIWGPLLNGGTCVIHPEAIPTGEGLARIIQEEQVNTAWLTAALFNRLVDENPLNLRGLRTLMTGGEALSPRHVSRILDALPGLQLINGYGPTESTTFAVTGPVSEQDLATYRNVPLGRPINWTFVRVLTPAGAPTPPGLPGELYIGGPGLALGYLNHPELTSERFVPDPFSPGAQLYRSGDQVRWLDDGRLEFLGRLDGQMKIRGYRIEPGEIEAILATHPAVRNAAITDECPPNGERRLVAWLVATDASANTPEDESLRQHCRSQLPSYMMPARFVWVPHLPITLNGKLDRRALQAMETDGLTALVTTDTDVTDRHVTDQETNLSLSPNKIQADIAKPPTVSTQATPALQAEVIAVLKTILSVDRLGPNDNFFEVGGSSLLAARALTALTERFGPAIGIEDFFGQPTAAAFADRIAAHGATTVGLDTINQGTAASGRDLLAPRPASTASHDLATDEDDRAIAIIGMAGRFPGADDIGELWSNLIEGRDGIRHFQPEELDLSLPASLTSDPNYVPARGVLCDAARFDAAFFGISPREAELMDPQQRIFLELAWSCLENAGHAPRDGERSIGVFAGMYNASYFQKHLRHYPEKIAALGEFQVMLDNEKDYIATRTANRLNLQGPAVSVHTACSTSLVAIVEAVLSLRAGQCRMALAGGVAVTAPVASGYLHEAGSMLSPDGKTRTFDADAQGTVFSDGAAVVLLKRLSDARQDGDTIHAIIRGVGLNNDGGDKASFTAPSVDGQHAVIRAALKDAGLPARSIQYVEAHGTATPMGDPVEVAAITRAWREQTADKQFALISSLKSYIGHTVIAAGAASAIKVALSFKHQLIPGTLHYQSPNPALSLDQTPFRVTAEHTPWPIVPGEPRRAAISAFGVGGTNAHIILEEPPAADALPEARHEADRGDPDDETRTPWLLPLSARTTSALHAQQQALAAFLSTEGSNTPRLGDIAFTLVHGRTAMNERQCVVASHVAEAIDALAAQHSADRFSGRVGDVQRWVWLFPGQGAQYAGMGRDLYQHEPVFAEAFDEALRAISSLPDDQASVNQPTLPADESTSAPVSVPADGHAAAEAIDTLIQPEVDALIDPATLQARADALRERIFHGDDTALAQTSLTQPALFALEYALARYWQHLGLKPDVMIGHSLGEFAAAAIAGVMRVADAGRLVALRGRLIQALPAGGMLAVRMPADALQPRLPGTLSIATINAPNACVVAGPLEALDTFAEQLASDDIAHQRLNTSHAFHSAMMEPAVSVFEQAVAQVALNAPAIPIISGRTGQLLEAEQITRPSYWAEQIRDTVRFAQAAETALATDGSAFLELGPGQVLTKLLKRAARHATCIASFGTAPEEEIRAIARARAQLWCVGATLLTDTVPVRARRVALPTYPFEGKRHWLDAPPASAAAAEAAQIAEAALAASAASAAAATTMPGSPLASAPAIAGDAAMLQQLAASMAALQQQQQALAAHGVRQANGQAGQAAAPAPVAADSHSLSSSPSTPDMSSNPNRQAGLHLELAQTIDDVCGIEITEADRGRPFVELGLDSLLLTQLALQIKRHFNAPVTFRQLMTELQSADEVVRYLDSVMPADAPVAAAPATPATAPGDAPLMQAAQMAPLPTAMLAPSMPALTPAPLAVASTGGLPQLIQLQLQLMEQQLRVMSGQGSAPLLTNLVPDAQLVAASSQPAGTATPLQASGSPVAAPAIAASQPSNTDAPAADERATDDPKKAFGALARIYRQQQDALTPRQEARLDAFIERYVAKTRASRDFTEKHRPHSADPRVVNGFRPRLKEMIYQIVIERSKGSHLWDLDGNEYVDALNGFGMSLFGWQPDFVVDAVKKQMDLGYDIGPQHPLSGPVTELVCEMTGFDRAALCNTGSEAVMGAVRIARTVTGRDRIAVFSGAYHGIFDEVIVRQGARGRSMPAAPGIMPNTAENITILEYGEPSALEWIKANADTLAAVLVEPVQSRRPELQPREFLHELRRITEAQGSLLIFDEVVTGFRTGPGGAQAHFDIRADLASYGKVIGGGFPIGIIAGKREYMDALDGGAWQYGDDSIPTVGVTYFAGTFVRHPLALAACHAVLTHLKEAGPSLQQQLTQVTTDLADSLNRFCREHGAPIEVRHFASVWRIVFTEDHPYQDLLFAMMRNRGIHILDNFPCFMTTAHTPEDIEAIRKAFCEAVQELQADGFLPASAVPDEDEDEAAHAFDPSRPPVPGARLGRDAEGKAAWFVADPNRAGAYIQLKTRQ
ncbi:MAG: amino acid adenylation domain-containing protein [Lautropia sp.]|nr:amino acid adenylation domain-containing protein [Lautropia sp.]